MEINHGSEMQAVEVSGLALDSTIHSVVPSEFRARQQQQDEKFHKQSQQSQLRSAKSTVFNPKQPLQHTEPSELCTKTKLQYVKSMEFNSEQQSQDVKSELGLVRELPGTQSLQVNLGP